MNVNTTTIKGFDKLREADAKIFKAFLKNFYQGQGKESRKTFVPQKVAVKKDKATGRYLRFDYKMNGRQNWLHVLDPWTWF